MGAHHNSVSIALFSNCTIFIPFLFEDLSQWFLCTHCVKYPQINLPLSADIMLICNMLAGGCAARRSELPAVCLHFTLFNVGSLVCEAQLHDLIVNQSIPCEHACPNACRLVIFYPNCPRVIRERVNAPTVGHTQAISLNDRWRNPGGGVWGGGRLSSSNSPSLQMLVSDLFLYGCLGCISAFSDATGKSSSRYSARGLPQTLPVCAFFMILLNAYTILACNRDNNSEWVIRIAISSIAGFIIRINIMMLSCSHCFHKNFSVLMTFGRFLRKYWRRFHFRGDTAELFIPEGYRCCGLVGAVFRKGWLAVC